MEKYKVTIIHLESKEESELTITADEAESTENIVLSAALTGHEVTASDCNYLPAYQKLRDHLLTMGYGIRCKGSRLNAVQSGMMGANDMIYLVELGQCGRRENIASLYDYSDLKEFPDTRAQTEFLETWSRSI